MSELENIIQNVKQDSDVQIDENWVNEWLNNIEQNIDQYHYLENKTTESIHLEKVDVLSQYPEKEKWLQSLKMYRYVNDLQDIRLGTHIRWIREKPLGVFSLTNGGIVVQIKFLKNGTYIVCKNGYKMMQYPLDNCKTFQKMREEEILLLMANHSTGSNL